MAYGYYQFSAVFSSGVEASAIAVVLSGLGVDEAQSLESIKAAGGVTFAQSPGSAQYAVMPKSAIDSGTKKLADAPSTL
jgi:two-component system, chemotaxis family, CheB/CheR fusion protein